jgi:pantothenate kinase
MTGFSLNILELIKMKKINENIRIITVKAIYSKILILLNFVKKC